MFARVHRWLRPRKPRVDFYAASWIDEVWIRSAASAAAAYGIRVRLMVSGDRDGWPADFVARYHGSPIGLEWAPTVERLHELQSNVVISASSGIPREYFGPSIQRLIHMPHSLASLHTIYDAHSFDGFDTLFAAGPHHVREFAALGNANSLKGRSSHACGYGKFDIMRMERNAAAGRDTRHVLIAPSWGSGNVLSLCGAALVNELISRGWDVTLRPHPSYFVHPDESLDAILRAHGDHPRLTVETSTGGSEALWHADVMVTDYSGMAMEYAALRYRPVVFVDGPRKILNPHWEELGLPAAEVAQRSSLGLIAPPGASQIADAVEEAIGMPDLGASATGAFVYDEADVGRKALALLLNEIPEIYA